MRPWRSCGLQRPWFLSAGTGQGCGKQGVPSLLLADSGICRRILHVLYTDCIRQCSGPLYVVPAWLSRPSSSTCARSSGGGGGTNRLGPAPASLPAPLPPSQSPRLCFPPGPYGVAGHGQYYQLVPVSLATVCGHLAGCTVGDLASCLGGHGHILSFGHEKGGLTREVWHLGF